MGTQHPTSPSKARPSTRRVRRSVIPLVLAACACASGCNCTRSLDVAVGVRPNGDILTSRIEFYDAAQCEIQDQIRKAVREFVSRIDECAGATSPTECRADVENSYRVVIDRLLEINEKLGARGVVLQEAQKEQLLAEAKRMVREYIGR